LTSFKSGQSPTCPDLEPHIRLGFCFRITENNTPDETNGVSNAVSCNKEPVQFSASLMFLTKFVEQCVLYFFCPGNTKIVNKPFDRSAALVLSVINALQVHWQSSKSA